MNNKSLTQKVIRGTGYITTATILGYVISLFYRVFLARGLGPETYGLFTLVLMIGSIFITIFSLGIPQATAKFMAEKSSKKQINELFTTSLSSIFFLGATSMLLILLMSHPLSRLFDTTPYIIGLAAVLVIPDMIQIVSSASLQGLQRFGSLAIQEILHRSAKLVLTLLFITIGLGLTGAVWAMALGFGFSIAYMLHIYNKKIGLSFTRPSLKISRRMTALGLPLMIGGLGFTAMGWTDTVVIGAFLNHAQLGMYNAVLPIQYTIGMAVGALATVLLPTFSRINSKGNIKHLERVFNQALKYTLYLMVPMAVGAFLLASYAVTMIFGPEYIGAVNVFKILSFAAPLIALKTLSLSFITGTGDTKFLLRAIPIVAVLNAALDLVLINRYGIEGIAVATVISMIVLSAIFYFRIRRKMVLSLTPLIKAVMAAAVMSVPVILILQTSLATEAKMLLIPPVGAVVYLLTLFLIRGINDEDRRILKIIQQNRS